MQVRKKYIYIYIRKLGEKNLIFLLHYNRKKNKYKQLFKTNSIILKIA